MHVVMYEMDFYDGKIIKKRYLLTAILKANIAAISFTN